MSEPGNQAKAADSDMNKQLRDIGLSNQIREMQNEQDDEF